MFRVLLGLVVAAGCASAAKSVHAPVPESGTASESGGVSDELHVLDEKVAVGDLQLHIRCHGRGEPLVVFEAGLGADSSSWTAVATQVSKRTRVCIYDRAGRGSSGPAPVRHDQHQMATELHALLDATLQSGPYVLVGHSMGAAIVRWFAADHPSKVVAVVLVDPATEEWAKRVLPTIPPELLPDFWANVRAMEGMEPQSYVSGYERLAEVGPDLGDRPLVILTAANSEVDFALRKDMHDKLRRLSTNVLSTVVPQSGHMIPIDAPDAVASAVGKVLDALNSGETLTKGVKQ